MSATFVGKEVKIRDYIYPTTVPNNPHAKLMYYLNCVSEVVDVDDSKLTDYQNYDQLNNVEFNLVYKLAKDIPPSLLINARIFIVNQNLLSKCDNHFYEMTDETIGVHVNSEIIFGGKVRKVKKVMACNNQWLTNNYYNPIKQIENKNYLSQITYTQTTFIEKPPMVITTEFKSSPVSTGCPYCNSLITTKTQSKLNFLACICCLMFPMFYCLFQICSEKNPCCCDVSHRCPKCGAILGSYNAC